MAVEFLTGSGRRGWRSQEKPEPLLIFPVIGHYLEPNFLAFSRTQEGVACFVTHPIRATVINAVFLKGLDPVALDSERFQTTNPDASISACLDVLNGVPRTKQIDSTPNDGDVLELLFELGQLHYFPGK
jgi:hypothetical protein